MAEVPEPGVPAPEPPLADDDFVVSLKRELTKTQATAGAKTGEDLTHRAELNRRLLQDLWEVHNQFEEISVHVTIDPSQTLFATFVEYPTKWTFKESFDFGAVKTVELADRAAGWVGSRSVSGTTAPRTASRGCAASSSGATGRATTATPGGCE